MHYNLRRNIRFLHLLRSLRPKTARGVSKKTQCTTGFLYVIYHTIILQLAEIIIRILSKLNMEDEQYYVTHIHILCFILGLREMPEQNRNIK